MGCLRLVRAIFEACLARFWDGFQMDEGITPWDLKNGFLVKNYPYDLIPRCKLANPGQNIKKFIFI